MSKVKAAAMIFGGLTTCMAGVLLTGYVVSPTVGSAASRDICTVSENMNGAVSYVPLENTVITDSSKREKETDNAVAKSDKDGANNVENIRKTANTSENTNNEDYKFAVMDIQPASYDEPVFIAVPQETSVNIYSQYKGETPAVENYVKEEKTVQETPEVPENQNKAEETSKTEEFEFTVEEVTEESTEPEKEKSVETAEKTSEPEEFEFTIEEVKEEESEKTAEPEKSAEETPEVKEVTEVKETVEEVTEVKGTPEVKETVEEVTEVKETPEVKETVEEVAEPEIKEDIPDVAPVTTEIEVQVTPTVTTQYVAQPAESEETQPVEETPQESAPSIPLSQSEYIALCNAVAHEAGCNWISTRDKANVVEVIMNRVYSSLFPNSVIEVLTQQNQFTGAEGYAYLGYLTSDVSQDVLDAVDLYFSNPESFNEGYLYFYGDGYQNHFSQGGWW
ncbi:MAG: cell wall hydrolase [Ruminococcus sp.]|nr:cell wall hydrolase [Ruminococcus sp.]